jgi:hypothetical protein
MKDCMVSTLIPQRRGAAKSGESPGGIFVAWIAGLTMYSSSRTQHSVSSPILQAMKQIYSRWKVPGTFCE